MPSTIDAHNAERLAELAALFPHASDKLKQLAEIQTELDAAVLPIFQRAKDAGADQAMVASCLISTVLAMLATCPPEHRATWARGFAAPFNMIAKGRP